jgi:hypothetical protein
MKRTDMTGRKIGNLTVLRPGHTQAGRLFWVCRCDCGKETSIVAHVLQKGEIKSCGCYRLSEDLVGRQFTHWTVIDRVPQKARGTLRYVCRCECGTVKTVHRKQLLSGLSKSCGCWWKIGVLSAIKALLNQYKTRAFKKNYSWELTDAEFRAITSQNCHYCGDAPSQRHRANGNIYVYNGIDRKDSSLGYTPENSVPCCKTCNFAKRTQTVEEFSVWVSKVYENFAKFSANAA